MLHPKAHKNITFTIFAATWKGAIMEIKSTPSFNAILATIIEDCAKDGGEEFFTEMHCVRITNL